MERFALKVDLSEILDNVCHQKVMILVDPQWPTVAEVESKIKKMFNIGIQIGFKNSEGFFLPREEPAEILKYVNMLIAFKAAEPNESTTERTNSKSTPEIITTAEFAAKKKRKFGFLNEENFTTSTPNQISNVAKRLKNSNDSKEVLQRSEKKKQKKKTSIPEKVALQEISNKSETKSISKSKHKTLDIENSNQNSKKQSDSHIIFDSESKRSLTNIASDSDDNVEKSSKLKLEVVFLCELTDHELGVRGRSFDICHNTAANKEINNDMHQRSADKQKPVSIIENITLVKPIQKNSVNEESSSVIESLEQSESCLEDSTRPNKSLMSCNEDAIIDLNESDKRFSQHGTYFTTQHETVHSNTNVECIGKTTFNSTSADAMLSSMNDSSTLNETSLTDDSDMPVKAKPLTELPDFNDKISFKIVLVNNSISDNFVGICEYVNKRTKTIKLRLIAGHTQLRYVPQKYAGNVDDSNGLTILNVKLQDMIEPKILEN